MSTFICRIYLGIGLFTFLLLCPLRNEAAAWWIFGGKKDVPAAVIGIVDTDHVFKNAAAMNQVVAEMSETLAAYQAEFRQHEKNLRAMNDKLERDARKDSDEAHRRKVLKFQKQVRETQQNAERLKRDVERRYQYAIDLVREKMALIVSELAEAENLTVVLPTQGVLWMNNQVDLTEKVLEKLDQTMPTLSWESLGPDLTSTRNAA